MKVCSSTLLYIAGMLLASFLLSGKSFAQTGASYHKEIFSVKTESKDGKESQIFGTNDYYASTYKLYGTALRTALHNLIKGHTSISYDALWTAFKTTDKKANGKVWDMYSDIPGGTPPYEYTFTTNQCGNYSGEGSCYNREHSWPKSWFNDLTPMYTDLFHLFPTDGQVNGMRNNYNYGNVSVPTWTSKNGSKLGPNTFPGFSGVVFEPINSYKGDLARGHMYMSVRYYTEDAGWSTSSGTNKCELLPWYANLLYSWSMLDTVSTKELDRNEAVYAIQKNRNPFIDHPEFAAEIWKTTMAPEVVSIKEMNLSSVLIDFSRYLDSAAAVTKQNFSIDHAIGNPASVEWGVNNDISKIIIKVPALATGTTYSIQVSNLKSINNVAMTDTVITFKTSGLSGLNDFGQLPQKFILQQNFPNPFNPTTVIGYQLAVDSRVSIKVFDILGTEVAELVNNWHETGTYKVTFDAGSLASGIYFYSLTSGEIHLIKKMIIVR